VKTEISMKAICRNVSIWRMKAEICQAGNGILREKLKKKMKMKKYVKAMSANEESLQYHCRNERNVSRSLL
jgi:hypothetical protein